MGPWIRSFAFLQPKGPMRVDLRPMFNKLSAKKAPAGRLGVQFYHFSSKKPPAGRLAGGPILSFVLIFGPENHVFEKGLGNLL